MSVDVVSMPDMTAAWLRDFDIDSAALKQNHRIWLEGAVLLPMELDDIRISEGAGVSDGTAWSVTVVGTTSRTASYEHNLELSRRRAEAVRTFLAEKLDGSNVVWSVDILPLSELPAAVLGARDDVENMVHRAVFVMAERHEPGRHLAPRAIRPPDQSVSVDFYLYAHRGAFMNVMKWRLELYAQFRHKGKEHHYGWTGSASTASVSPSDVNKAWTPPLPSTDHVLAGPARVTFPSPGALDRLNGKTIFPGSRGGKFRLRIENGNSDGGDLILEMPFQTSAFELSQGVGSLDRRGPMSDEAVRTLKSALWHLNTPRTEDGHILL